ncbi:MAG: hypothetical protein KF718_30020 [Polyangiaceae bacterium]|nr:hypothetical protein [Polyangiaceae bacterium]
MTIRIQLLASTLAACATLGATLPAVANTSVIKRPGAHPDYVFEAEPHLAFGFFDGPLDGEGIGPGFRGTIELVDNGFITTINNTVGIGFGLDWLLYGDHCPGRGPAPRNCHDHDRVIIPVVMQWNFWLTRNWSVFGEPGLALRFDNDHHDDRFDDRDRRLRIRPFVFYAGGRYHFNDAIALTMRVGHPTFSVGVSFFL